MLFEINYQKLDNDSLAISKYYTIIVLQEPVSEEVEQQLRQLQGTFCVDALELGHCTKQFCLLEHALTAKDIMDYYRIVRVASPQQLQGIFRYTKYPNLVILSYILYFKSF